MRSISIHSSALLAALSLACSSSDDSSGAGGAGTATGGGGSTSSGGSAQGGSSSGGSSASGGAPSGGGSAGIASGGAAGEPAATGGAAGETASGGTGGGASGACTNAEDQSKLSSMDVGAVVGQCAKDNLGAEPGTRACIKQKTNLSDPCVDCFDAEVQCGAQKCWLQCIADSESPDCINCRKANCDPAFEACSGLTVS